MSRLQELIAQRRAQGHKVKTPRARRFLLPKALEIDYANAIKKKLLEPAFELVKSRVYPQLERYVKDDAHADVLSINDVINEITRQVLSTSNLGVVANLARAYATRTSDFQKRQLIDAIKQAIGIDIFVGDQQLAKVFSAFVTTNVAEIKSIPIKFLNDVETLVAKAFRAGVHSKDLQRQIQDRFGVSANRARLIARDQLNQLFADVSKTRQQEIGVKSYVWRTMGDSRVRPEHRARDGKTFEWNNAPSDGHPGEAIACRCYAEPYLKDLFKRSK